MARSTTVRVVNATPATITLTDAALGAGRWREPMPAARVPAGGEARVVNSAVGRFGGASGRLRYAGGRAPGPAGRPASSPTVELCWRNPFVGRNAYAMAVTGRALGAVCDGDDDHEETTVTFTIVPSRRVTVPGFLPSTHGFRFTNSWPDDPLRRISLRIATVPIGSASNGLCGGMCFAVRDWFESAQEIPTTRTPPPDRSPLREFLIARLLDSFDLPGGVAPYATLMSTRYPDDDGDALAAFGGLPSRASVLTRRTWPSVRASIDNGHPCPLGLVMVASDDPADMRHHHQVLAYAYRLRGTVATLWVYDPNSPDDDRVTIEFDTARTDRPVVVHHNVDVDGPLVCAFVPRYVATSPPEMS